MAPDFIQEPVRAEVPATSANLGPGYDSFGLALSIRDQVSARLIESGLEIAVTGEGTDAVARDETHLIIRSMRAAFQRLGGQPGGIRLDCLNRIPHGRGLGSSAAAIVAGVELARSLVRDGRTRLDDAAALALATELEGHPDNVAACLYGGLTVAWTADGVGRAVRVEPRTVLPVVFIPTELSATEAARAALPQQVPHADAAFNAARSALLVLALTGRPDVLLAATEDRLHQAYRAPGMRASADLMDRLRSSGIAAVISGAGSSVLALAASADQVAAAAALSPDGWRCVELTVSGGARVGPAGPPVSSDPYSE
ncbi:MAG: homoserine kinase [Pseudonocardiales bacterium]|jgi:homoserine kinase|nr:homoserine kinase [Pseudonocardiales bacterium]